MAGCFVDAVMRSTRRTVPVLGLLDEFKSAVGRLGVIETAMGLASGYGLQLLPVFQNLSQLQELYPQGRETFLANSGFRIFFAPRDKTTSDYISDMAGVYSVLGVSQVDQHKAGWRPFRWASAIRSNNARCLPAA